jgi:TrwC relaxase
MSTISKLKRWSINYYIDTGLASVAYQHETSRCGDPHLHTHVIVPNRQARTDGQLVSIDGTSLYHEAKAAVSSIRPPCAVDCTSPWALNGRLWTRRRGWRSWPGWTAARSPRGRGALHPVAGVGRPQPHRCRWSVVGGAAGGWAESHPPGQTRRAGLDHAAGAVARRCARPAP